MLREISFSPLLIITLLAFLIPIPLSRLGVLRLPILVGELLCGILIGKTGLNVITIDAWLDFLSYFGLIYLMFLSGLELDLRLITPFLAIRGRNDLWYYLKNPITIGILSAGFTIMASLIICQLFSFYGIIELHWLIALILSTTSVGVVVPIIKERRLSLTPYGQTILLATIMADFLTMFLFTVGVALVSKGITFDFLLVLIIFLAFFAIYRVSHLFAENRIVQTLMDELSHATSQIRVRGCFVLILLFVALSQQLGVEIILGSFLAGVIISLLAEREGSELHRTLDAIGYGFFIPIFFIMVGVGLDLRPLLSSSQIFWMVFILLAIVYAARLPSVLLFRLLFPWPHSLGAASLLSARLSLSIAAAIILFKLGLIDQSLYSALVFMSVLTCILSPLLFNWSVPQKEEPEKSNIIIVGGSELGCLLADRLATLGEEITLIEKDPSRASRARQLGLRVLEADGTTKEGLEAAGCEKAKALVATTSDDQENIRSCKMARTSFGLKNLISLINNLRNLGRVEDLGIRPVHPIFSLVNEIHNLIHHPSIIALLTEQVADKKIVELPLYDSKYLGRPLRELHLPGDCLILSINRDGEYLIPHGDTILKREDTLTILGGEEFLSLLPERLLGTPLPRTIFSLRHLVKRLNERLREDRS